MRIDLNSWFARIPAKGAGRALRHPNYAAYAFFGWLSNLGWWVQRIGVQWLAWQLTHSYAWLGIIALVEATTTTLAMPLAGALADRMDRLHLARIIQVIAMCVAFMMAVVTIFGDINIWILVGLIAINGAAEGAWTPSRLVLVPSLVPLEDMPAALAVGGLLFNVSQFVGPALAGALIASFGVGYTFALNSLSYIVFLITLFLIRINPSAIRIRPSHGIFTSIAGGIAYIRAHRAIGAVMAIGFCTALLLRPHRELMAGYADGLFGRGAEGLAALASASGGGGLLASLLLATYGRTTGLGILIVLSLICAGLFHAMFAFAGEFYLSLISAAGLGMCLAFVGMGCQILVQNAVVDDMRGRVMSIASLQVRAAPSTGAWLIGSLAGVVGLRMSLGVTTILVLGLVFVVVRLRGQFVALEARQPDGG